MGTRLMLAILTVGFVAMSPGAALKQGFKPNKPIEIVVAAGPGSGPDGMARSVAMVVDKEKLLPVPMQVTNKPGGNTAVASAYLAEKKGETHTISIFTGTWFTNPLVSVERKVTLKDLLSGLT